MLSLITLGGYDFMKDQARTLFREDLVLQESLWLLGWRKRISEYLYMVTAVSTSIALGVLFYAMMAPINGSFVALDAVVIGLASLKRYVLEPLAVKEVVEGALKERGYNLP